MGFWLAAAEGPAYEAAAAAGGSAAEISAGDTVVDVQYYERVGPDTPLTFHAAEKATVHARKLLCVSGLEVGRSRRQSARLCAARPLANVELQRTSSIRVMEAWKLVHPGAAGRVI